MATQREKVTVIYIGWGKRGHTQEVGVQRLVGGGEQVT